MANYPKTFTGQDRLQPGSRGEAFQADLPGYRNQGDRINRTNMQLATSAHDVPNIKWEFDRRLPVLFRYGFAVGFNQMVIPKGRIVAVDPAVNLIDFDTNKAYNALTLANGGVPVKLRDDNKQWEPVVADAYEILPGNELVYRALKTSVKDQMTAEGLTFDSKTGMLAKNGKIAPEYRPANTPIGIMSRNEYTRSDDAFNGMQPGAVMTDAMVDLPLFLDKTKAEQNPWGSAYGNILPGDLVKSDENGRIVPSPLSRMDMLSTEMTATEIEKERQQIIGQAYSVSRDLVPAGAAKYATWALSDRLNFEGFNPLTFRGNYRDGEDINEKSPYKVQGGGAISNQTNLTGVDPFDIPGHPYDRTMSQHDLHMLASTARKNDLRLQHEYQYENLGIPGLTDGYNAVVRQIGTEVLGEIRNAATPDAFVNMFFKTSEVSIEPGSVFIEVSNATTKDAVCATNVTMAGQEVPVMVKTELDTKVGNFLKVSYIDEKQGFVVLEVSDKEAAFEFLNTYRTETITIKVRYKKRGLAGVPTFLDWDGCVGVVKILLQK